MIPGVHFTAITTPFYCNDGNGNFLFHKRSKKCRDEHGAWDAGGGRLGFGQTPEESVLREVLEEYSCTGIIQDKLPTHTIVREWNGKKTHWVAIPFFILVDPKKVKLNEPEKMDELAWHTLDNLPDPIHSGFFHAYSNYKSHFDKYRQ